MCDQAESCPFIPTDIQNEVKNLLKQMLDVLSGDFQVKPEVEEINDGFYGKPSLVADYDSASSYSEPPLAEGEVHSMFAEGQVTLEDDFLTEDDIKREIRCPLNNEQDSDSESEVFFEVTSRCRSVYDPDDLNYQRPQFTRTFDDEYYFLPALEQLVLEDKPTVRDLRPFGVVSTVIDFVVTIKPLPHIPALDYDSVLFNDKCEVIGTIFEIFGLIEEPNYAIRFNTEEEAKRYAVDTEVFYAPNYLKYTKTFFPHDLSKVMYTDDGDNTEPEFSDDDDERAHSQKKRAKYRQAPQNALPGFKKPRQVHFGYPNQPY
ncbi:unnamed protein product [Bursaphelenchus xylophilus]|uniref:H/ACA ribonucleoprotein complex subunit n=1 Tax=Bursaphelenchus xylophilus TaxID=6326 RepID=A0A1I7RIS4_BURXY|nr:unnamed protein product [Bursaphelenchus xylophilus]CAG9119058.1 unnamed protein product [Bursaphelenchus xylophilus]